MGAACCVAAAKERTVSNRISIGSADRNIRYSPSWSFRWEGESHLEDSIDSNYRVAIENCRNDRLERNRRLVGDIESSSERPILLENIRRSPGSDASDFSPGSAFSIEEKDSIKIMTPSNPSVCPSSSPSLTSISKFGPSSSQFTLPDFNPSRRTSRSPVWQHSRQASDNQIFTLRSPNETCVSEGRHSFMLSAGSSDFRNGGSFGGSSDGWSMRAFSEFVTSHRGRWSSFDSENATFNQGKLTPLNSHLLMSPTAELQACGMCSKLLREPPSLTGFSVVAILFCGHAFHAECLESVTSEANKSDPPCPVCTVGEKRAFKRAVKSAKAGNELKTKNKLSRIGVADGDDVDDIIFVDQKRGGKSGPMLGASSSMKISFAKPFLRRHFSMGGIKSGRATSEEESISGRKKGFWNRYRKN